uniref:Uncharacterized protein n=1 Tax=Arundo donax TaxID=35708 RepID=A0A0A9C2H6_ARUDO
MPPIRLGLCLLRCKPEERLQPVRVRLWLPFWQHLLLLVLPFLLLLCRSIIARPRGHHRGEQRRANQVHNLLVTHITDERADHERRIR